MFDDISSYSDVLNSSLVNDNAEWASTDHVSTNGGHAGSSIVQSGQDIEIAHSTMVIEASGAVTLSQVDNGYFLYATGTTTGPQLKYDGDAVWAGQFGLGWTPIGVEASAGGYQVVWKADGDPHTTWYAIWNVDSDGNFTSNDHGWLTADRWPLGALELPFGQDLNGDDTLGPTTAVIEAVNATTLAQVADTYFLYATGTTTGPQLKYDGDAVWVGQFGLGWTPIGVEASAGGYQVVWKADGDSHTTWYAIWNVDSDGNFTSNDHAG